MTVLFAGNEIDDFILPNTNAVELTTAGTFDSAWVPCSIKLDDYNNAPLLSPIFTSLTEAWVHFQFRCSTMDNGAGGSSTTAAFLRLWDNAGTERLRINSTSGGAIILSYYNGSAWAVIATSAAGLFTTGILYQFDFRFYINGASSSVEFYIDKTLAATLTGTLGSNIAQIGLNSTDNGADTFFSQIIVADENTLWFKYKLTLPTANSATNTAFTGDYTAVDEPILSDADFITSGTANQVETYTAAARDFTGYTVKAAILNIRALRDTTGPQNMQGVLRIGGTNYFTATKALTIAFAKYREYYTVNPATGIAWTPGGVGDATLEFGVKSIA